MIHIKWLPIESATFAEIRGGGEFRGWSTDRYMLATLINAVRALIWVFTVAHSDPKKRKPNPPEPFPTPDKPKKVDKPGSFAFIAKQHLAAIKKKEAGRAKL